MKNDTVILPINCREQHKKFYARYDLAYDGIWNLTRGLKELPYDGSGKIGETADAATARIDLASARFGPQYKCPYCKNPTFVQCGNCKEFTCYSGEGMFTCGNCGASGQITGSLTELNGSGRQSQH